MKAHSMRFGSFLGMTLGASTVWALACGGDPQSAASPTTLGNAGNAAGGGTSLGGAVNLGGSKAAGAAGEGAGDVSGVDPNAACASETQQAKPAELDMALLVDTSYSMDFDDKWVQVSSAIKVFAGDPRYADLGVALQFFPLRLQCSVTDYANPAVALAPLSKSKDDVVAVIDAQRMAGGTPLVPALEGMSTYLQGFAKTQADRRRVLVVATDGIPDNVCVESTRVRPNTIPEAVKLATELAAATSPVKTFVIGVGSDLEGLNAIAKAGGTDAAIIISTAGDVQKSFLAALAKVRKTSLPCDYSIPPPKKGSLDLSKVNVLLTKPGTKQETLLYTGGSSKCADATAKGWYFDSTTAPKKVVLCPDTCEAVKAVEDARVDTVFGCKRQDVPIR